MPVSSSASSRPITGSWLSESEWARLYRQIRPTPLALDEFRRITFSGSLGDMLTVVVLNKVSKELKSIMEEHGWLREARVFTGKGKKSEVNGQVTNAVRCVETTETPSVADAPASDVTPARGVAAAAVGQRSLVSMSPVAVPPVPGLPFATAKPPTWTSVPQPGTAPVVSRQGALAATASTFQLSVEAASASSSNAFEGPKCPSVLTASLMPLAATVGQAVQSSPSTTADTFSSPMARILVVLKRFQLRMGSFPIRFEIPQQYIQDLTNRRLRVQVIPMTGNAPSVWPKVKELFVFVNERNVQVAWKRAWPEKKKCDMAKAYLPLDITQFLVNPMHQTVQRLQMDCFNHEYCGSFAVVLVVPRTEGEVMADHVAKLTKTGRELQQFYQSTMKQDDGADGDVVWDVPTVSLKCPISQARIVVPVRGRHCSHLQCVDFAAFLRYCHIGCYWNCPLCDAPMRLADAVVDRAFQEMLELPHARGWSHAQLTAPTAPPGSDAKNLEYSWGQSEKHKGSAVDISDSEDDDHEVAKRGVKRGRSIEASAAGTADEPIML